MKPVVVCSLAHEAFAETAPHVHEDGQLFRIEDGSVNVEAGVRRWLLPGGYLGWVPPRCPHAAWYPQPVAGRVLYCPDDADGDNRMPAEVKVVRCDRFLASLLDTFLEEGLAPVRAELYWQAFVDAFRHAPDVGFCLPLPQTAALRTVAAALLARPDLDEGIDHWAAATHRSRRSFCRHFRDETGMSFVAWRQSARLWRALELLSSGWSVTATALEVGYHSVSAFIQLFRRRFGMTPLELARHPDTRV
jgi:AraC-like DNA-binding protein